MFFLPHHQEAKHLQCVVIRTEARMWRCTVEYILDSLQRSLISFHTFTVCDLLATFCCSMLTPLRLIPACRRTCWRNGLELKVVKVLSQSSTWWPGEEFRHEMKCFSLGVFMSHTGSLLRRWVPDVVMCQTLGVCVCVLDTDVRSIPLSSVLFTHGCVFVFPCEAGMACVFEVSV